MMGTFDIAIIIPVVVQTVNVMIEYMLQYCYCITSVQYELAI